MLRRRVPGLLSWSACLFFFCGMAQAQDVPSGDQLEQLLAPIALYPDTLLAQICAAAGDPQQIIDADNWLKQNGNLAGTALTDAAQQQGFDPAFISLVTFPSVLDAMAENIDDYAAIGEAFKADQASVMAAIQTLRQQAYASGALDSNQYQNVSVEDQNGSCQSASRVCATVSTSASVRRRPKRGRCRSGFVAEFRRRHRYRCADQRSAVGLARMGLGLGRPRDNL